MRYHFLIIGGGIVGLATALAIQQRWPEKTLLLLEKEDDLARHQTGHNSGVIHAGVYYQPGSLKARFCKEGAKATYDYCRQNDIPFEQTGKIIAATSDMEMPRLLALFERCRENALEPEMLSPGQLSEMEPNISARAAFLVRESGITSFPGVCRHMAKQLREGGASIKTASEVDAISETQAEMVISAGGEVFRAAQLVVCAGLMADRMAVIQGLAANFRIIPFRGEYFRLHPRHNDIIRHLVYPVPDPDLPFLGIHLTRMIDGSVTVGPNAVPGWKREGYGKFNFSARDTAANLAYPGFWKLALNNLAHGLHETRNSLWKRGYLAQVNKYCPTIELDDLQPYPAGIRAQAVLRDGTMVHDFLFEETARSLHVCNAPSPAATSAIPIGRHIAGLMARKHD